MLSTFLFELLLQFYFNLQRKFKTKKIQQLAGFYIF